MTFRIEKSQPSRPWCAARVTARSSFSTHHPGSPLPSVHDPDGTVSISPSLASRAVAVAVAECPADVPSPSLKVAPAAVTRLVVVRVVNQQHKQRPETTGADLNRPNPALRRGRTSDCGHPRWTGPELGERQSRQKLLDGEFTSSRRAGVHVRGSFWHRERGQLTRVGARGLLPLACVVGGVAHSSFSIASQLWRAQSSTKHLFSFSVAASLSLSSTVELVRSTGEARARTCVTATCELVVASGSSFEHSALLSTHVQALDPSTGFAHPQDACSSTDWQAGEVLWVNHEQDPRVFRSLFLSGEGDRKSVV